MIETFLQGESAHSYFNEFEQIEELKPTKRATATEVTSPNSKFLCEKREFSEQFSSVYTARLSKLKPSVVETITSTWPDLKFCDRIVSVLPSDEVVAIIGTVYKLSPKLPDLLKEYSQTHMMSELKLSEETYASEKDTLFLEDETGRVSVQIDNKFKSNLVTGMVVGMKGKLNEEGVFEASDFCFPGVPPQLNLTISSTTSINDKFVVFLSGIHISSLTEAKTLISLDMCTDFLLGIIGSPEEQKLVSRITTCFVCGNSLQREANDSTYDREQSKHSLEQLNANLSRLDKAITSLCSSMQVYLMPGQGDPATVSIPQQPFNACLLPTSAKYNSYHAVTNPFECVIEDRSILGTSGQNVDTIARFVDGIDRLSILELLLRSRHIAPIAPEFLGCLPFHNTDPLTIDMCPNVFFAANQPKFEHKIFYGPNGQKTLLLLIPEFATTNTIVLCNLSTLEAIPFVFEVE